MKAPGPELYDRDFARNVSLPAKLRQNIFRCQVTSRYVVGSVLDLGCGLGLLADMIDGEYLGVDFSPFAIEWARANTKNHKALFLLGDLRDLPPFPCARKTYDTVVMAETLEHLDDPASVVAAAFIYALKRIVVTVPVEMGGPDHVKPAWNRKDLEGLLGGLSVCEVLTNADPRMAPTWFAVREL